MKMRNSQVLFFALLISLIAFVHCYTEAKFSDSVYFTWGAQHSSISADGEDLQLVLDQVSGFAIQSKNTFLFGNIEMLIKLVPGNSAGTVTWRNQGTVIERLSSNGSKHDKIDFEFLGNTSGQPYIIHTNVFTLGNGSREQHFYPWFDPTADYHNYTIHWNPNQIVWFVEGLPIHVFRNYGSIGVPFPNKQGMVVYSSLWNADNWATRGGLEKIDWNSAPFTARMSRFRARACKWEGDYSIYQCSYNNQENWFTSSEYKQLSYGQKGQMKWVRDNYMIYDYCKDTKQFNGQITVKHDHHMIYFNVEMNSLVL